MGRRRYSLTWVARTPNTKTGDIPSAYIGETVSECADSCRGCALQDKVCYAWKGFANASLHRIEERKRELPGEYTFDNALKRRSKKAKAVRVGAMGDPAQAKRAELREVVERCAAEDLTVISYTHFWREDSAQDLRGVCLASTDDPGQASEAIEKGWIVTTILPWDHYDACGPRFYTEDGKYEGFVCPAQTKGLTCNDCRMCSPGHQVWKSGKVRMIGFLDHSKAAIGEKRRMKNSRQLPLFRAALRDTSPVSV